MCHHVHPSVVNWRARRFDHEKLLTVCRHAVLADAVVLREERDFSGTEEHLRRACFQTMPAFTSTDITLPGPLCKTAPYRPFSTPACNRRPSRSDGSSSWLENCSRRSPARQIRATYTPATGRRVRIGTGLWRRACRGDRRYSVSRDWKTENRLFFALEQQEAPIWRPSLGFVRLAICIQRSRGALTKESVPSNLSFRPPPPCTLRIRSCSSPATKRDLHPDRRRTSRVTAHWSRGAATRCSSAFCPSCHSGCSRQPSAHQEKGRVGCIRAAHPRFPIPSRRGYTKSGGSFVAGRNETQARRFERSENAAGGTVAGSPAFTSASRSDRGIERSKCDPGSHAGSPRSSMARPRVEIAQGRVFAPAEFRYARKARSRRLSRPLQSGLLPGTAGHGIEGPEKDPGPARVHPPVEDSGAEYEVPPIRQVLRPGVHHHCVRCLIRLRQLRGRSSCRGYPIESPHLGKQNDVVLVPCSARSLALIA